MAIGLRALMVGAMFPPDSVIRRVSAEPALLFGAGRALLLQLAHPAVAQGVSDHSEFKRNPFARLQRTPPLSLSIFAPEERERFTALRASLSSDSAWPPLIESVIIRADGTQVPVEIAFGYCSLGGARAVFADPPAVHRTPSPESRRSAGRTGARCRA